MPSKAIPVHENDSDTNQDNDLGHIWRGQEQVVANPFSAKQLLSSDQKFYSIPKIYKLGNVKEIESPPCIFALHLAICKTTIMQL